MYVLSTVEGIARNRETQKLGEHYWGEQVNYHTTSLVLCLSTVTNSALPGHSEPIQIMAQDDLSTDPPCHATACAIQSCLSKNSFDEQKCQAQIDALYSCCNAFYEKFGDDAKTVSCPMANLLRLKIEQRKDAR